MLDGIGKEKLEAHERHLFSILAGFFLGQKLTYIQRDRLTSNTYRHTTPRKTKSKKITRQSLKKSLD